MKARPKSAKSQFQVNFQAHMTFQRNKKFIDLEKLADQQKQYSIMRRKPLKSEDNHISQKINLSFMNTTAQLTQRAIRTATKHRSRISFQGQTNSSINENQSFQETQPKNKSRSRSFSIEKMTSRQYHHRLRNKPVADQRRFNNFQKFQAGTPLYCNYDKMLGKKQQDYSKKIKDIQYNTQKLYEQYYYKKTTNNCKVDYKSQRKLKSERVFFHPKRPEQLAATDLQPQKVDSGLKIATNYKTKNISNGNIDDFYRNSGRQLPSEAQKRQMNQLTNYWKGNDGVIRRKKLDYQARKMKQDMTNQRMKKIQYSKQAKNQRKQMCDQKFFKHFKL